MEWPEFLALGSKWTVVGDLAIQQAAREGREGGDKAFGESEHGAPLDQLHWERSVDELADHERDMRLQRSLGNLELPSLS